MQSVGVTVALLCIPAQCIMDKSAFAVYHFAERARTIPDATSEGGSFEREGVPEDSF